MKTPKQYNFKVTVPGFGEVSLVAQINSSEKDGRPDKKTDSKEIPISIRPGVRNHVREESLEKWGGKLARYSTRQGTWALLKQKVVIVTQSQLDKLRAGTLTVQAALPKKKKYEQKEFDLKTITWDTITVSECPNSDGEFNDKRRNPNNELTYTILCRWEEDTPSRFPQLRFIQGGNASDPVDQTENFLISPKDPIIPPSPPISAGSVPILAPDDFKPITEDDDIHYSKNRLKDASTVAVIDTGLKFNLENLGQLPGPADGAYHYRNTADKKKLFNLAYQTSHSPECGEAMSNNHFGCCTVASYQEPDFIKAMNDRLRPFNPPYTVTPRDVTPAVTYTGRDVRDSPYDDHVGRHGTVIAAIIQQQANINILPVKSFDNRGFGTLFDVLSAFNYILRRHKQDPIRVVNASWVTKRKDPLLRRKIEELKKVGIFLVAAAGNRNQTDNPNLSDQKLYPACYSQDLPNVITVTSVMDHYSLRKKGGYSPEPKDQSEAIPGLQDALLNALRRSPADFELATDGLDVEANYGNQFVNIGVKGLLGSMPSPFKQGDKIWGSSFAAPFVAAKLAEHLKQNRISLTGISDLDFFSRREEILNAIQRSTDNRLQTENLVEQGRYITTS